MIKCKNITEEARHFLINKLNNAEDKKIINIVNQMYVLPFIISNKQIILDKQYYQICLDYVNIRLKDKDSIISVFNTLELEL